MREEGRGTREEGGEEPGCGTRDAGCESTPVAGIDEQRRGLLRFLVAAPLAPFAISMLDVERAARHAHSALVQQSGRGQQFRPGFFTPHELRTVRLLADLVIPRDEHSGSATDAGVPEFMDFIVGAYPTMQPWMRDGLKWLDAESKRRSGSDFVSSNTGQQTAVLDDIAWPKRARPATKDGAEFFTRFRDLTSSGFWSSRIGVQDLGYIGNTALAQWNGCPPAALRKLGVDYRRGEGRGARGEDHGL